MKFFLPNYMDSRSKSFGIVDKFMSSESDVLKHESVSESESYCSIEVTTRALEA